MCKTISKKFASYFVVTTLFFMVPSVGIAQQRGDMFVGWMESMDLFRPHDDFCESTEAFVSFDPLGRGFCIEKSERSAANFEDARAACVSDGKRLPEPSEWQYSCDAAATLGLSDMTDNDCEWASNSSETVYYGSNGGNVAPCGGNGSCGWMGFGLLGASVSGTRESLPFRCLR